MRSSSLLLCLLLAARAFADGPFVELDFDAASAQAKAEGKLLLVDFTATWCPPCKMMEKQTWPDEKVQAWVREHAVAIQVDIDKLPELAQKFSIQAIPTVVFLKDGEELDRHTGFRGPAEFVEWGDGVAAGKITPTVRAAETAANAASDDPDRRYAAAKDLAGKGQLDAALEGFLWVWKATRDVPKWSGVRHSFLLGDMARLAERHAPAQQALESLLDEAQRNIESAKPIQWLDWIEWSRLCGALGQEERIVAWYEAHRDANGAVACEGLDAKLMQRVQDDIFKQLLARHRFVNAGRAGDDFVSRARSWVDLQAKMTATAAEHPSDETAQISSGYAQSMLARLAPMYGCAFAAGQVVAAHQIADLVVGVLDTPGARISLVRAALDMSGTSDPQLTLLLDKAAELGGETAALRAEIQKRESAAAPAPAGG